MFNARIIQFLNNNANNLTSIDLMFTQKCLCRKYIPKYKTTANHSPSINLTPSRSNQISYPNHPTSMNHHGSNNYSASNIKYIRNTYHIK